MNVHAILGIAAGLLNMGGNISYFLDTLKGKSRPNVVSWGLWTLIISIAVSAQFAAGASWSVTLLLATLLGNAAIVVLCFLGFGYAKYDSVSWACLVLALIAILLWIITSNPIVALIFSAVADFVAAVPTLFKAWHDPFSEEPTAWCIYAGAAALSLAATTTFNLANALFPIYLFVLDGTVGCIVIMRHPRIASSSRS